MSSIWLPTHAVCVRLPCSSVTWISWSPSISVTDFSLVSLFSSAMVFAVDTFWYPVMELSSCMPRIRKRTLRTIQATGLLKNFCNGLPI